MIKFLTFVTDMGDSAVLVAVVCTGILYLWSCRCRKGASALALSLVLTAAAVAAVKILFIGCTADLPQAAIRSPSGHAALSVAVWGTYALLIEGRLNGARRFLPLLVVLPLIVLIACSRVWLGVHTEAEVATGFVIGSACVLLIGLYLRGGEPVPAFDIRMLTLWIALVALLFHGLRLPAESLIHLLASRARALHPLCALWT